MHQNSALNCSDNIRLNGDFGEKLFDFEMQNNESEIEWDFKPQIKRLEWANL